MKKYSKKFSFLLAITLAVCLITSHLCVYANALDATLADGKRYSNADINQDFADDTVLVVINNKSSLNFKEYSSLDFSEISSDDVLCLNESGGKLVRKQLDRIHKNIKEKNILTRDASSVGLETTINPQNYNQVLCIKLKDTGKENVLRTIDVLNQRDDVLYAGPDYIYTAASTVPNDTEYAYQSPYANQLKLPEAWDITTGASSVTVGVIDSGIDGTHPDLDDRINVSLSRDFSTGSTITVSKVTDVENHGTHVAGIIGAEGDNAEGICGVCWDIELVSLRVFEVREIDGESELYCYFSEIALAVDFATANDIPILNFSGVGPKDESESPLYAAISSYPGLFVCSAGNEGNNNDINEYTPAGFRLPNLISVGACDVIDARWIGGSGSSNYGKATVDIFAPGELIPSTSNGGDYIAMSGTSQAAPYVTGVAALLLSKYPAMTAYELKHTIMANVDEKDAFTDLCISGGRLNAYNALSDPHYLFCTNSSISGGHIYSCDSCSYTYTEPHDWIEYSTYYKCSVCNVQTTLLPIEPAKLPEDVIMQISLDNSAVSINENTTLCYIDGEYYLVKGYSGDAALQYAKRVINETVTE